VKRLLAAVFSLKNSKNMFQHDYQVRVRYADTDQMGYVYYGKYASFYEIGRVEALRSLGFSYRKLEEEEGIMMPVLDCYSKFIAPAFYDELITIRTIIHEMPKVRIFFEYELYNEQGKLINSGKTTLAFIRKDTSRPCRVPEGVVSALRPFFEKK